MSTPLQMLALLAVIILVAKMAGWVSSRLGQPAVLGELLAGLLLGPSVINLLQWPVFSSQVAHEVIVVLSELGVILLMLIAGMEVDLRELRQAGRVSLLAGVIGVIVPLLGGWGLSRLFHYDSAAAFSIGVLLSATSVSISAQTLLELGVLRSQEGIALLGAAVVDDVLVLLILSAEVAFRGGSNSVGEIALIAARMVLFLGVGGFLCLKGLPWLMRHVQRWRVSAAIPTAALIVTFFVAWAAEYVGGVAAITGAFLVGLGLRRSSLHSTIVESMHTMGYALFVPLFFVSVGLETNIRELDPKLILFTTLFILVAVLSKIVGCGLGAWAGRFKPAAAFRLGLGMISRGEVGLIAAALEIRSGWIDTEMFAAVTLMVLATTILAPLLLKIAFRRKPVEKLVPVQGAKTSS